LSNTDYIDQSDGTSWVAMLCLNLMRIALVLSEFDDAYQDMATKFFDHFIYIANSMTKKYNQGKGLWNPIDKFYYDILKLPDGKNISLKVRSMVGLIPLLAVDTLHEDFLKKVPRFEKRLNWFFENRPDLSSLIFHWKFKRPNKQRLLSLLPGDRLKIILKFMLNKNEFLSDYGIRSLSRYHLKKPFVFKTKNKKIIVSYLPAESDSRLFGGNSNWRGPIWFPLNYLIIESLKKFYKYYEDDFKIEFPTNSKKDLDLKQIAAEISKRLSNIFLPDGKGNRAVFRQNKKIQTDPNFKNYLLFYEYFHGDNGRGIGASHQTGWTSLIATLLQD